MKVVSAVDGTPLGNARVEASPGTTAIYRRRWQRPRALGRRQHDLELCRLPDRPRRRWLTHRHQRRQVHRVREGGEDLVGLVQKPCTGDPSPHARPKERAWVRELTLAASGRARHGRALSGHRNSDERRWFHAGQVQVIVEEGIPGPDGSIEDAVPTSGAKILFGEVGSGDAPPSLTEIAPKTGLYLATAGAKITPGKLYSVSIDGDGNGSIDGSGTAFALGNVEWTNPTDGDTVNSADFTASWSDSGSTLGGAAYAPVYEAIISSADGGGDAAIYIGTDREFPVKSLAMPDADGLQPGKYTGTVIGFKRGAGRWQFDHQQQHHGCWSHGPFLQHVELIAADHVHGEIALQRLR